MLRCSELGLVTDEVLDSLSMGMVFDMLIERENDKAEYEYIATWEDTKRFFG